MMKLLTLVFLCVVAFSFSVVIWKQSVKENSANIKSLETSPEVSAIIDRFWQASLSEHDDELGQIVTKVPEDYYSISNKCEKESGESESAEVVEETEPQQIKYVSGRKSLSAYKIEQEYGEVLRTFQGIRKKNYTSYKIIDEKIVDNHALVKVEYGESDDSRFRIDLFLLNKEDGRWKIFMITLYSSLLYDNKYFANLDCTE